MYFIPEKKYDIDYKELK